MAKPFPPPMASVSIASAAFDCWEAEKAQIVANTLLIGSLASLKAREPTDLRVHGGFASCQHALHSSCQDAQEASLEGLEGDQFL